MKTAILLFAMALSVASSTSEQETGMRQAYVLPKSQPWNTRQTLKCKAVASVSLRQKGLVPEADQGILVASDLLPEN